MGVRVRVVVGVFDGFCFGGCDVGCGGSRGGVCFDCRSGGYGDRRGGGCCDGGVCFGSLCLSTDEANQLWYKFANNPDIKRVGHIHTGLRALLIPMKGFTYSFDWF